MDYPLCITSISRRLEFLKEILEKKLETGEIGITLSRHSKTLVANIFLTISQKIRIIGTRLTCDEILLTFTNQVTWP